MKIITWNVNSVHARLPRLIALLGRYQPDLVCLQEIKASSEEFPAGDVAAAGYQAAVHGQVGAMGSPSSPAPAHGCGLRVHRRSRP